MIDALRRELLLIVRARRRTLVWTDQPLVMITQMPRSGGTLLARLFDGHPACHVFPRELRSIFISDSKATGYWDVAGNVFVACTGSQPTTSTVMFDLPYPYTLDPAADVPTLVGSGAGLGKL